MPRNGLGGQRGNTNPIRRMGVGVHRAGGCGRPDLLAKGGDLCLEDKNEQETGNQVVSFGRSAVPSVEVKGYPYWNLPRQTCSSSSRMHSDLKSPAIPFHYRLPFKYVSRILCERVCALVMCRCRIGGYVDGLEVGDNAWFQGRRGTCRNRIITHFAIWEGGMDDENQNGGLGSEQHSGTSETGLLCG